MTEFEKLEQEAADNNVDIDYVDFKSERLKGLYCDGSIALSTALKTTADKACTTAEELGHYYTSSGNILDQSDIESRKQERRARLWAYNKQIGLMGLVNAFKKHCHNLYDIAKYLNVSEEFLMEALDCYRSIYGESGEIIDNYIIKFEPYLQIYEIFTF